MSSQERIYKVYELIKRKPRKIEEIADILQIKRRTVSSYLKTLRNWKMVVSTALLDDGRVKIHHTPNKKPIWRMNGIGIKQEA